MGMKLAAIMFVLMLAMAGLGKWYYSDSQARIATLRENAAKLETAVQISESSIKLMQENAAKNAELNMKLQADLNKAEQYGDELRATLQKHNLTALALRKPGLIEKRMNDATSKLWSDISSDTSVVGVQPFVAPGTQDSNSN